MTWFSQILSKRVRGGAIDSLRLIGFLGGAGHLGDRFGLGLHARARSFGPGPHAVTGTFGDARPLAGEAAQVIELGAPHHAAAHHIDRGDAGRIQREDTLHSLAVRDLPQREIRVDAGVLAADANAFEDLDALPFAFDDFDADPQRVAGLELRDRPAGRQLVDLLLLELL